MTSVADLIFEAESFCAGCSRDRLELRLVDALLQARYDALISAADDIKARGDVGQPGGPGVVEYLQRRAHPVHLLD